MPEPLIGGIIGPIAGAIIGGNAAEDAADAQVQAAQAANATQLQIFERQREDLKPYREAGYEGVAELRAGLRPRVIDPRGPLGRFTTGPGAVRLADPSSINDGPNAGYFLRTFDEPAPTPQDITSDPGYQFRMAEGAKALERSAAARGGLLSGGTGKALTRYGQGVASDEFDRAYGRYNDRFNRFQTETTTRFNRLASLAGLGQTANSQTQRAGEVYGSQVGTNQENIGNALSAGSIAQGNAWTSALGSIGNVFSQRNMFSGS